MQLGLAETLQILIGCDQTDKLGMDLAIRIETLFRDRCKEYKDEKTAYKSLQQLTDKIVEI